MSQNAQRATMKDIARSLNVSITTVSKVINGHHDISEKTRQDVMSKIIEMGYVPNIMAANLRRAHANIVALIFSDATKPYFGQIIEGYESVLEREGYSTITLSSNEHPEREKAFLRSIASLNMAGIIIDPSQNSDKSKEALEQTGLPYVFSSRFLDENDDCYVAADNRQAGYTATAHLLKRKPGRPVFCVNGPNGISVTVMRFQGYCSALAEAGMKAEEKYIFNNCFGLRDAYEIGLRIAKEAEPPFSVFCSTDQMAAGVMRAFYDSGIRVPADAGVIGVDDIDISSYLVPALTTVAIPRKSIGEMSARMLVSLMRGEQVQQPRVLLPVKLIVREST